MLTFGGLKIIEYTWIWDRIVQNPDSILWFVYARFYDLGLTLTSFIFAEAQKHVFKGSAALKKFAVVLAWGPISEFWSQSPIRLLLKCV